MIAVRSLASCWVERCVERWDDTASAGGQDLRVGIDFFSLLDDDGWVPVSPAFDGEVWLSTKTDRSFKLFGVRCRANFTIPMHHLNVRQLMIVLAGELVVESGGEDVQAQRVGAGQFFVTDAGTPFKVTAGPEGATYIENFPQTAATIETVWD